MKRVCLDAGHFGKYNLSPAVSSYYESERMWVLHEYLAEALEKLGIEVIKTRKDQKKDLELTKRGKTAKGCDLFLSLHSNAVGSYVKESVDYPVVYVPLNGKGDKIGQALADCIAEVMQTKQKGRIATRKGSTGKDYYGVIRGAVAVGVPGLILEHSFHTCTAATKWLLEDDNLKKLAQAEAETVARYLGVDVKEEDPMTYEEFKAFMQKYEAEKNAEKATWEKDVMALAKKQGMMDGTRPKAPLTRGEMAQVLKNAKLI